MLYSEDCECHSETVDALSRCLETLFNCRVCRIDRSQDIATQLGNTHVVLFVNSKNVFTYWNMHRSSLSHSQEPFSRTAFDLGCMIQKLLASYRDRVVMVRLDYTEEQHVIQCKNNHVFNIPRHMSELICRIHELGELAGKDSARKCLEERQEGKDLLFSIEKASQCCGRFRRTVTSNSVVELIQGDAHGVGEPDLAGQGAHVVELRDKALQGAHSGDLHDKALPGAPRIDLHDKTLQGASGVVFEEFCWQETPVLALQDIGGHGEHGVERKDVAGQGTDGVVIRTEGHSHEVALQERHVADTYPWVPPRLEPNTYNSLEEVEEHLFQIIQNYGG